MPAFAWLMEMGAGKTLTDIWDTQVWLDNGDITGWIVIAPKGVYHKWETKELPLHARFPYRVARWRAGAKKAERWAINTLCTTKPPDGAIDIFLINVEGLATKKCQEAVQRFIEAHPAYKVSVDESTRIKGHDAKRSKAAVRLGRGAVCRRILTGFPYPSRPLDAYMQFNFLDPNILGFKNFYAFRAKFAIMKTLELGPRSVKVVKGYRNLDRLQELIEPYSYRILKEEALPDLPPKIYERRHVEMNEKQQAAYQDLLLDCYHELETAEGKGIVSAQIVLTQLMRLQQVVAGHVKTAEGLVVGLGKVPRMTALIDLLDEIDDHRKVVIWSNFVDSCREIHHYLTEAGYDAVRYWGEVDDEERVEALDRFENDPDCRYFVGNPATGGEGIDLYAADTVIYYSNDYNLGNRMQSEDRTHRGGQTSDRVLYIDFETPGTVDSKILKSLASKFDISSAALGEDWRAWLNPKD